MHRRHVWQTFMYFCALWEQEAICHAHAPVKMTPSFHGPRILFSEMFLRATGTPSPSLTPTHPTDHQNIEEGKYTKTDCLRLAKTLTDLAQVPAPCKEVVQNEQAMRKAFEGATVTDRARHAIATRKGTVSHHQLQRRLTSTSETMAR